MTDWDSLLEEHGRLVFRICWRILGHAPDVEDAVQEVFLQAFRLQRSESVRHWPGLLRRLAVCTALQSRRRRKPTVSIEQVAVFSREREPDENLMQLELEQKLLDAIAELPEREATVFCLRFSEGLSHSEIAESLDLKYSAVATALHRARSRLEPMFAMTRADCSNPRP